MQERSDLVDSALVGARIRRGTISAGYNQVIPSQPIAKNVLKTKRKTACPTPARVSCKGPSNRHMQPARIAMETDWPAA